MAEPFFMRVNKVLRALKWNDFEVQHVGVEQRQKKGRLQAGGIDTDQEAVRERRLWYCATGPNDEVGRNMSIFCPRNPTQQSGCLPHMCLACHGAQVNEQESSSRQEHEK